MNLPFLIAAIVAVLATLLTVTRANAVHALLYFVVSLFAVAVVFLLLGAPFVAALEVIVYAGAIMVLFLFVVMLIGLGKAGVAQERAWLRPRVWLGPSLLALALLAELVWILGAGAPLPATSGAVVTPKEVGRTLLGPYLIGVEVASFLLLAGLVGAWHLARPDARRARSTAGASAAHATPPTPSRLGGDHATPRDGRDAP